jgi:hypothetical protein
MPSNYPKKTLVPQKLVKVTEVCREVLKNTLKLPKNAGIFPRNVFENSAW